MAWRCCRSRHTAHRRSNRCSYASFWSSSRQKTPVAYAKIGRVAVTYVTSASLLHLLLQPCYALLRRPLRVFPIRPRPSSDLLSNARSIRSKATPRMCRLCFMRIGPIFGESHGVVLLRLRAGPVRGGKTKRADYHKSKRSIRPPSACATIRPAPANWTNSQKTKFVAPIRVSVPLLTDSRLAALYLQSVRRRIAQQAGDAVSQEDRWLFCEEAINAWIAAHSERRS